MASSSSNHSTWRQRIGAGPVVLATHNKGKVPEIAALLQPLGISVISAGELGLPEPEETETSFEGNARLKAQAAAIASGLPSLADDSGLEVSALGGAPGVYSARWAGPEKDFALAMDKIANELHAVGVDVHAGQPKPEAQFVCALCLAFPDTSHLLALGTIEGHLEFPPRGEKGFGYDPIFVGQGMKETFAQLEPAAKHAISHRANAFAKLLSFLETQSPV